MSTSVSKSVLLTIFVSTMLGAGGCGEYSVLDQTPGAPSDPGRRHEGGGYGSGSGSGSMPPPPPPMCDPPDRRCAHELLWKGFGGMTTGNEKLVELRGDYKTDGW